MEDFRIDTRRPRHASYRQRSIRSKLGEKQKANQREPAGL